MRTLALETGSSLGSIALLENCRLVQEIPFKTNESFGQNLFENLEEILIKNQITLSQIDLIAVNTGPGSYTGLRVGITCANTLAWASQTPSIGISSLLAMAYSAPHNGSILCILYGNETDAFFATFEKNKNEICQTESDKKTTWNIVKDMVASYSQVIYYASKNQNMLEDTAHLIWQPSAEAIGLAAQFEVKSKISENPVVILPNYLKEFEVTSKQKK